MTKKTFDHKKIDLPITTINDPAGQEAVNRENAVDMVMDYL